MKFLTNQNRDDRHVRMKMFLAKSTTVAEDRLPTESEAYHNVLGNWYVVKSETEFVSFLLGNSNKVEKILDNVAVITATDTSDNIKYPKQILSRYKEEFIYFRSIKIHGKPQSIFCIFPIEKLEKFTKKHKALCRRLEIFK